MIINFGRSGNIGKPDPEGIKIIVRDCRQITFVTLNRFCPLSKKPSSPLFLMDNIKIDRIPTEIKSKIHTFFTLHFKFEGTSYKNL